MHNCHITTVSQQLSKLGIEPTDTRRAFAEDLVSNMPQHQIDWLVNQLGPHLSIKDYLRNLLTNTYFKSKENTHA